MSGRIWPSNTSVTLLKMRASRVVGNEVMRSTACCSCLGLSFTTGALAGQLSGTAAAAGAACSETGEGTGVEQPDLCRAGGGGGTARQKSAPSSRCPPASLAGLNQAFHPPATPPADRRGLQRARTTSWKTEHLRGRPNGLILGLICALTVEQTEFESQPAGLAWERPSTRGGSGLLHLDGRLQAEST